MTVAERAEEINALAREILIYRRDVSVQESFDLAGLHFLGAATVTKHAPSDDDLRMVRDSASHHLVKR